MNLYVPQNICQHNLDKLEILNLQKYNVQTCAQIICLFQNSIEYISIFNIDKFYVI